MKTDIKTLSKKNKEKIKKKMSGWPKSASQKSKG